MTGLDDQTRYYLVDNRVVYILILRDETKINRTGRTGVMNQLQEESSSLESNDQSSSQDAILRVEISDIGIILID